MSRSIGGVEVEGEMENSRDQLNESGAGTIDHLNESSGMVYDHR